MQPGWKGPKVALYINFDDSNGLDLMEGTQEINQAPLISGKVCKHSEQSCGNTVREKNVQPLTLPLCVYSWFY